MLNVFRFWNAFNGAVEWVALLLRIFESPISDLGSETGYFEVSLGIPQSLQLNARIILQIITRLPSQTFHFIIY
jgi:hypothetical protein